MFRLPNLRIFQSNFNLTVFSLFSFATLIVFGQICEKIAYKEKWIVFNKILDGHDILPIMQFFRTINLVLITVIIIFHL